MEKKLKLRCKSICQYSQGLFEVSITRRVCFFPIRSISKVSVGDPYFSLARACLSNSTSLCINDLSIMSGSLSKMRRKSRRVKDTGVVKILKEERQNFHSRF